MWKGVNDGGRSWLQMRHHGFGVRHWQWAPREKQKSKLHEKWRINKFGQLLIDRHGEMKEREVLKFLCNFETVPCEEEWCYWLGYFPRRNPTFDLQRMKGWRNNPFSHASYVARVCVHLCLCSSKWQRELFGNWSLYFLWGASRNK